MINDKPCDRCKYPESVQGCGCNTCPKCRRPNRGCAFVTDKILLYNVELSPMKFYVYNSCKNLVKPNDWFIGEGL
jgi:hypothetical protein